jgi:DNA-binding NtrC family response regulator
VVAIMVTAYAESDGVDRALRAGTWRVLRKPIDFEKLLGFIEEAVH